MGSEEDRYVDIGKLMANYKRSSDKFTVIGLSGEHILRIRRWENYPLSAAVVTTACLLALIPKVILVVLAAIISILILTGKKYVMRPKYRKCDISSATLINEDKEHLRATAAAQLSRQQELEDFRQLLCSANKILIYLGTVQDRLISVFNWDNERHTLCVLGVLLTLIVSAMWISIPTMISVGFLMFFCWNKYFLNESAIFWGNQVWFLPSKKKDTRNLVSRSPHAPEPSQTEMDPSESTTGREERPELSTSFEPTDEGQQPTTDTAVKADKEKNCCSCGAAFSILKRKHSCSRCLYFFCSQCSIKVPRSMLGATSPAAFLETVRVCHKCKADLENDLENPTDTTNSST